MSSELNRLRRRQSATNKSQACKELDSILADFDRIAKEDLRYFNGRYRDLKHQTMSMVGFIDAKMSELFDWGKEVYDFLEALRDELRKDSPDMLTEVDGEQIRVVRTDKAIKKRAASRMKGAAIEAVLDRRTKPVGQSLQNILDAEAAQRLRGIWADLPSEFFDEKGRLCILP